MTINEKLDLILREIEELKRELGASRPDKLDEIKQAVKPYWIDPDWVRPRPYVPGQFVMYGVGFDPHWRADA